MSVRPIVKKVSGVLGPYIEAEDGDLVTGMIEPVDGGLGIDASGWDAYSYPAADGTGNFVEKKNNLAGVGAPTVNDDSGDGYSVGSFWIG